MSDLPRLEWASPAHHGSLLALFRRAFGAEMPAAEWHWNYPPASGLSLLARREGAAVAHYGGQPRRLLAFGRPLTAVQISDIMVDPAERGALGRGGLFAHIATTFTEQVTPPQGPHAFVFGFPSPRATRLGELLGLYARLDTLQEATWPARRGRPAGRALTLHELAARADPLWQRQSEALAATHLLGVRDRRWVESRYRSHPSGAYRGWALFSRFRRRCLAAAVYREHAGALELIDLLGDPAGYPRLVASLRCQAARLGKGELMAWATPAALASLAPSDRVSTLLQVNIAGPDCQAQAKRFQQRCWMTAGDTDYR